VYRRGGGGPHHRAPHPNPLPASGAREYADDSPRPACGEREGPAQREGKGRNLAMSETIELNGRRYRKPRRPTVVICADGCDPEYLERGIPDGIFPTIGSFGREGYLGAADA